MNSPYAKNLAELKIQNKQTNWLNSVPSEISLSGIMSLGEAKLSLKEHLVHV